jgi:hypothetical protein
METTVVTGAAGRPRSRKQMRRQFLLALLRQGRLLWPILSGLGLAMAAIGTAIGRIEGWGFGEALYFTFVTGLTIGYGDVTPKHLLGRLLALIIGFAGIVLTGLIAAISVQALRSAEDVDANPER